MKTLTLLNIKNARAIFPVKMFPFFSNQTVGYSEPAQGRLWKNFGSKKGVYAQ